MFNRRAPVPNAPPPVASSRSDSACPFPSPRLLFAVLAGYFALQVILRVSVSNSVDLDESEAVVLAQQLCWGYGSSPPLYTWLQIPFFKLFGEGVLALSLLKNLLLFGTYCFTFAAAWRIARNPAVAVAAALSLFYLPQIAWESQRDLTHSVLSATLAAATLFCLVQLLERRRTGLYVLFGLCAGLGLLSKYNYALWLLGLLLGALTLPQFRPAILNWRLFLSLAITAALFLPHGVWILQHPDLTFLAATKFEMHDTSSAWGQVVLNGIVSILQSLLAFCTPVLLIYFLVFFRAPARGPAIEKPVYARLVLRAWLSIGLLLLALICLARATGFKERWFQPMLIALPLVLALLAAPRLDARRLKWLAAISGTVMLAVLIILPTRLFTTQRLKREEVLTRPYAALAAQLRGIVPPDSLIVCDTRLLAGNLRLDLPGVRALPPELTPIMGDDRPHRFLAWDARKADPPPPQLVQWAKRHTAHNLADLKPQFFRATYRFHDTKEFRLALLPLD